MFKNKVCACAKKKIINGKTKYKIIEINWTHNVEHFVIKRCFEKKFLIKKKTILNQISKSTLTKLLN
jgi:hypothetical protein